MSLRLRRFVAAMVLAVAVAAGVGTVMSEAVPSVCMLLTPDDWFLWWLYGCEKEAGGGGGGGAS